MRWADTKISEDGDTIAVESRCWDCKEEWQSRMSNFPDWSDFVEWAMSDQGQLALQVSASSRKTKSIDDGVPDREVQNHQSAGVRFVRECWVASEAEFKSLFDRVPNVKMPRLPMTMAPTENGEGMEKVYCWSVGNKVYPLRKMQIWSDLSTQKYLQELTTSESLNCKSRAAAVWRSSLKRQRTEWSQEILFGQARLSTIDEICSAWHLDAPAAPADMLVAKALLR